MENRMIYGMELAAKINTLPEALRWRALEDGARTALVFNDRRISYCEFDRLVDECARAMANAGLERGDRIAVLSTPRPEFLISLLAAMRMGVIWVGLNPKYTLPEIAHILDDSQPKLLLSLQKGSDGRSYEELHARIAEQHPFVRQIVLIGADDASSSATFETFVQSGKVGETDPVDQVSGFRDPAVIVYTSGSTGKPKGALLSAASYLHSYKALAGSFAGQESIRLGHRVICNLPINHVGCQADICGNAVIDGATIVFMEQFEPEKIPAVIEAERINIVGGLPLMIDAVFAEIDKGTSDVSSVQSVGWGGAPMPRRLVEELARRGYFLSLHYGLTEGGSINSVSRPGSGLETFSDSVGWPDDDNEYRVVDAQGNCVGPGETGQVLIRGPGVMLGYWRQPEATAAVIDSDGWLRTGDLVEVKADGSWRMAGRIVEMFKSGGYNVYPREVEIAIERHPHIAAAFVVSAPDPVYDEVGVAFVTPTDNAALDTGTLREFCRQNLANYKIPKLFVIRAQLPTLAIGKVDRKALKAEAVALLQQESAE